LDKKKKQMFAVALRYERGQEQAPIVTASGHGRMAERIIELAKENKVHIEKNVTLAEALRYISPGSEIPTELYEAVAVLLSHIMEADEQVGKRRKRF